MTAGISTSNSQERRFIGTDATKDISCHDRRDEQRERDVREGAGPPLTGEGGTGDELKGKGFTAQLSAMFGAEVVSMCSRGPDRAPPMVQLRLTDVQTVVPSCLHCAD